MNREIVEQILSDQQELLSIPQTLAEVIRISRDEQSSSGQLSDVLAKDPALTANLLRIVNSPFYSQGKKIGNLKQAVMIVGVRQVTALALSASVYQLTHNWDSSLDRNRFWRHSLQVAIASRMIAQEIKYEGAEEMFVAGLLHDIGLMILEQSFPDQFKLVGKDAACADNPVDCEENAWGTNHASVGQFLLEQWLLPDIICEGVGRHHIEYTSGADDPDLFPGQIVSLADIISPFTAVDVSEIAFDRRRQNRATIRNNLGLSESNLMGIEEKLFARTVAEAEFLEIEIGPTDELLAEANRLLLYQYSTVERLLGDSRRMKQQVAHERLQRASSDSLREATNAFAGYLSEASDIIASKSKEALDGVRSGSISDPGGIVTSTSNAVLTNISALRTIIAEMERFAEEDSSLDGNRYLDTLEERLKPQYVDAR